jgi:hypothetical protein
VNVLHKFGSIRSDTIFNQRKQHRIKRSDD